MAALHLRTNEHSIIADLYLPLEMRRHTVELRTHPNRELDKRTPLTCARIRLRDGLDNNSPNLPSEQLGFLPSMVTSSLAKQEHSSSNSSSGSDLYRSMVLKSRERLFRSSAVVNVAIVVELSLTK